MDSAIGGAAVRPYAQPGPASRSLAGLGRGVADDIVRRADDLAVIRAPFEDMWRNIARYFLPIENTEGWGGQKYDALASTPAIKQSERYLYDSTALSALDRIASGMESLVTPQSEIWHGLDTDDVFAGDADEAQRAWFEYVTKALFRFRYDARSGFVVANQRAIRGAIAFGNSYVYVEEAYGSHDRDQRRTPFSYSHVPQSQGFVDVNAQGEHDTFYRRFTRTARQLVQKFGDKVSDDVKRAAEQTRDQDKPFEIIHAVQPRAEAGGRSNAARRAPYASYYVEVETRHLIGESGYFEFPFAVYSWFRSDNSAYSESLAMLALPDVQGLNVMRKSAMTAWRQYVRPPLAVAHDGVTNRPNLNEGAINFGAIDEQGRPKIQPILTSQNPAFAKDIIEGERAVVRELLLNNLFQILIQNPQMTATEAMLRANEKGELLGPAGSNIQSALSRMTDREIGILERKGAFDRGAALEIPQSLQGRAFGVRFSSPLDKLRQQKEASGILLTYQAAGQINAVRGNADALDAFDDDKAMKIIADANNAPASIRKTDEEVQAMREARQQAMAQAANLQAAESMAKTAKDGVPALAQAAALAQGQGPGTAPLQLAPISNEPTAR